MTNPWQENQQRTLDLLADRALFGLEAEEARELEELLQDRPDFDRDCLDRTAAACVLGMGVAVQAPFPTHLRERIRAGAYAVLELHDASQQRTKM